MKKLEKLEGDLFRLPKEKLSSIKGGRFDDSVSDSFDLVDTAGSEGCDKKWIDTCIDW